MHENLKLGANPPRSTHANGLTSKFYTAEGDICDGAVKLIRTKQSGDVWQMRCWIHAEKKYIKKSLRTKDLDSAKTKGRELYYTMMGKVMGCSARFIEQHYDSAKVENMMDYITRDVERDDAFSDVVLT